MRISDRRFTAFGNDFRPADRLVRATFSMLVVAALLYLPACGTPIGVKRSDPAKVQRELSENVLTTGELSAPTLNSLRFSNLDKAYEKRPEEVIELVHHALLEDALKGEPISRRGLIALAEISFLHASRKDDRRYYLATALYAWLFLFPDDTSRVPDAFDPRLRLAADLYNRSVTLAFLDRDSDDVRFREEMIELPVGRLKIVLDESTLVWGDRKLVGFVPVSEYEVHGLRNRYRWRGIGAPLAAIVEPKSGDDEKHDQLASGLRLPVAALLRFDGYQHSMGEGMVEARLEIHASVDDESVEIDGRQIPLEMEPTTSIASMLAEQNPLWRDLKAFFAGDLARTRDGLVSLEPYRPGRIPIVFVHGTFSSSTTWAEIVNDLYSDPLIRKNFQFWLFDYNTGNPIAYSAWLLRTAIDDLISTIDPEGKDPALERMIVVGHSQGGLLTKLMAIDSKLDLWHLLSEKRPEEFALPDDSREILEGSLIVEPVSQVERVVFIATPHRGSYLANWDIAKWIGRFARSPISIANAAVDLVTDDAEEDSKDEIRRVSGSIDNMAPDNDFLGALVEIQVVPDITSHSIIALREGEDQDDGSDGVVKFKSAQIAGVSSELVVPSPHTCLQHPWTISELRRIILSHVGLERRGPKEMNLP